MLCYSIVCDAAASPCDFLIGHIYAAIRSMLVSCCLLLYLSCSSAYRSLSAVVLVHESMPNTKSIKSEGKTDDFSGGSRVTWSLTEDRILLTTLTEQKQLGNQSDNGWKKIVWQECEKTLKLNGHQGKTAKKCQNHFVIVGISLCLVREAHILLVEGSL